MKSVNAYSTTLSSLLVLVLMLIGGVGSSPVIAQTLIPADKDTQEPLLLSIGPIGARVKVDHRVDRRPRSESNSATVEYIFENSLAEGKLQIGDVITGVNGKRFQNNFSAKLAKAINHAEGGNGKLILNIERQDRKKKVTFKLKKIGRYSQQWPYECDKSDRILRDACDWLVAHQQPNGRLEKIKTTAAGKEQKQTTFVLTSVGGLAMLGCDPKRYKKPLKRIVDFEVNFLKQHVNADGHYENGNLEVWSLNYSAIFLAEYYLATKDKSVFPALEFLNQEIYHRQFHQADAATVAHVTAHRKRKGYGGDPVPKYWFGHSKISPKSGGYKKTKLPQRRAWFERVLTES